KGDSRGVDPSAEKKQKTEKRKEEKKKEKEVYFDSSDSDDEGLMVKALPIDVIWKKRVIRGKIIREGWMNDNGLNNVMELIKRQKWENLFKRRELVHTDAVKEFYAKMTVIHLKKKDIVKSKVRGVEIEFDHEKLATILGIPGNNGICEYVKDVWEESKYIKPLEITRRFANNETLTEQKKKEEMMMRLLQRKRQKMKEIRLILTGRQSLMRQLLRGNQGQGRNSMMLRKKLKALRNRSMRFQQMLHPARLKQKDKGIAGVDPSGPTSREADFLKFQAEFERKRANKFHDELEKAKAENAKLLALLHQAQTKPHP
ncbi:hypothetical protein Dimus_018076, partial [Dionaea muscipula]